MVNSLSTLRVQRGKKEKKCDERTDRRTNGRTDERTNGVTMSLLELLIAAKNHDSCIQKEFLLNSYFFRD